MQNDMSEFLVGNVDGCLCELGDIVALQQECVVLRVALRKQEGLMVAPFAVEIRDEHARVVAVDAASGKGYPTAVR